MSRTPDKNSVRQRAFKMLDGMRNFKRKTAMGKIQAKFKLGQRYTETIYATHRQMGMDAGLYTATYRIKDTRNGRNVKPYIFKHMVYRPKSKAYLNPTDAMVAYIAEQNRVITNMEKKVSSVKGMIS